MASKGKKPATEEVSGFSEIIERFKAHPFLFGGTVVVLVIVIVAFVFVPAIVPNAARGGENLVFGYYNGAPISYLPNNYFARVFSQISRYYGISAETDLSQNFQLGSYLWQEAFNNTLIHQGILDEMKTAGYQAPVAEINDQVASLPEFQEDGRFSMVKYRQIDKNRLLSLWRSMEEDYVQQQYTDDVSGILVSSREKAFIGGMAFPRRTFDMALFSRSSYPDSEIIAFASSNPAPFNMIHLSRITLASSERETAQLLESIKNGKTSFEDAARNQSTDAWKEQGGDLGLRMAHEMYREIADTAQREEVIKLRTGEYSGVVKVPTGWAFFRAEANPYLPDFSAEDMLSRARSYMREFEGGRMENWLVVRAEEFRSQVRNMVPQVRRSTDTEENASAFTAAAESAGIETRHFGPVNLNYGNVNLFSTLNTWETNELYSAVSNENFWRIAFATPLKESSTPFTLGDNVVVLFPVDETPADSIEAEYIAAWYAGSWKSNLYMPRMFSDPGDTTAPKNDILAAFSASSKFENKFTETFFRLMFQAQR